MIHNLLLLGESDVGKSHFGGQLLGRLIQEQGRLRMVGAPGTLTAFEGVLARLNAGRASAHTSQAIYEESVWPITDGDGRQVELVWPDYGGEQLRIIRADRRMSPEWRERVIRSSGWIVMVRIQHTQLSDDIFSRPLGALHAEHEKLESFAVSDQAKLVDLLQWLLFVRGASQLDRVSQPQLLVLLSCWDELPEDSLSARPADVLRERMPLVSSFIAANWREDAAFVLGLSALERPLLENEVDEEFVDRGPEAFGYMGGADGSHDRDLTLAIAPLI
jgi:hypothetical protein